MEQIRLRPPSARKTVFFVGTYVSVDTLPLPTTLGPLVHISSNHIYKKLQRQTSGLYGILNMRASTTAIDESGIPSTTSVKRTAHAPKRQTKQSRDETPHNAERSICRHYLLGAGSSSQNCPFDPALRKYCGQKRR